MAPIPVAGPEFRLYLTNSPKLFVEGNVYGMYFGGYGNFVSTSDTLGLTVAKHLSINAGYQLGSRLVVNNSSSANRIGVRLTRHGAIAGLELSFRKSADGLLRKPGESERVTSRSWEATDPGKKGGSKSDR